MGQYAPIWDHTAAIEVTKDWNGIDQVLLRNSQGASLRVRFCKLSLPSIRSYEFMILISSVKSLMKEIIFEIPHPLHTR